MRIKAILNILLVLFIIVLLFFSLRHSLDIVRMIDMYKYKINREERVKIDEVSKYSDIIITELLNELSKKMFTSSKYKFYDNQDTSNLPFNLKSYEIISKKVNVYKDSISYVEVDYMINIKYISESQLFKFRLIFTSSTDLSFSFDKNEVMEPKQWLINYQKL